MKLTAVFCSALISAFGTAFAQTPAPESAKPADSAQLEALAKKIDEQNAKIDALSQEILKLEQQVEHIRPGVMIGENTPSPGTSAVPAMSSSHPAAAGNTHTVARGETLTSIAKMYKVTVDELQQANHIEDGRKLQAGQTIVIPMPSPAAAGLDAITRTPAARQSKLCGRPIHPGTPSDPCQTCRFLLVIPSEVEESLVSIADFWDRILVRPMLRAGAILLTLWTGFKLLVALGILFMLLVLGKNSPALLLLYGDSQGKSLDPRALATINSLAVVANAAIAALSILSIVVIWSALMKRALWAFLG